MRHLLGLAIGLAVMTGGAIPAEAAFPGANGKLAFGSNLETCRIGCTHTLFTLEPDGSGLLSLDSPRAGDPRWSADGTRLVFELDPVGVADIYVRATDGALTQLTSGHFDRDPAWSPDGTKIAFTRVVPRGGAGNFTSEEIHVMNADGSGVRRLTVSTEDGLGLHASEPAWSPDGTKIAFTRVIAGGFESDAEIYVMDADGSGVTRVTDNFTPNNTAGDQHDYGPDWSPDGGRIAFSGRHGGNADIYTIKPDGTGLTRVTTDSGFDREPAWSPDGEKIAYIDARSDLWVIDADGTDPVSLLPLGAQESNPSWQPLNRPPDCSPVTAAPSSLWPPNKHLRTVTLSGAIDPDGDTVTLHVTGVTHDEGDAVGDWEPGLREDQVLLRAARDPQGDGRAYAIAFEARDEHGAACAAEATVTVPRHR